MFDDNLATHTVDMNDITVTTSRTGALTRVRTNDASKRNDAAAAPIQFHRNAQWRNVAEANVPAKGASVQDLTFETVAYHSFFLIFD